MFYAKTFLKHFSDCLFYFCPTCADSIIKTVEKCCNLWVVRCALKACMLAFYPEFESSSDTKDQTSDFEVTFLLDLSNSMSGSALQDAKKVLLLALRHLPSTCLFNVVVFGTCDYILFSIFMLFVFT